jgi:hypothetical protein
LGPNSKGRQVMTKIGKYLKIETAKSNPYGEILKVEIDDVTLNFEGTYKTILRLSYATAKKLTKDLLKRIEKHEKKV